jgi:hypothetical protein
MDISGPVRSFLRTQVSPVPAANTPLELLAQRLAFPEQPAAETPMFLRNGAAPILAGRFSQPMHGYLALASALRIVPRMGRSVRSEASATLRSQLESVAGNAEKILLSRATTPADFLWHFWLLVLARTRLEASIPEFLLTGLWRRAWGGWERRTEPGPLHTVNAFDDLLAIHAAYNAILLLQEHERLDPLEKLIRWHARHTQPAAEPWGLAAFAFLDETQTFAPRQIQMVVNGQSVPTSIALALLADALLTQEETAG